MSKEEIDYIGNQVVISTFRVQLDALLSVLDDSKRTKYQTALFDKSQIILDKNKKLLSKEKYEFFKELFESSIIRNEIKP
jgi:hypothetical protein